MPLPSLEYLLEASLRSLQELELASRNRSANMSKALRHELEAWMCEEVTAEIASWMINNREAMFRAALHTVEIKPKKVQLFESRDSKTA